MNSKYNSKLTPAARNLRKNMTGEERRLWYGFFRQLPETVNRQKVIGRYIVDFYCAKARLIIEIDGSQHYEADGQKADKVRDEFFASSGYKVLRYSNRDVNCRFREVCEDILLNISEGSTSSASLRSAPSPQGEGL